MSALYQTCSHEGYGHHGSDITAFPVLFFIPHSQTLSDFKVEVQLLPGARPVYVSKIQASFTSNEAACL